MKKWLKKYLPDNVYNFLKSIKNLKYSVGQKWKLFLKWANQSWIRAQNFLRKGPPIPPSDLVFLVAGTDDLRWFLKSGQLAYRSLRSILDKNLISFENLNNILDFGCGVGRVIRYFRRTGHSKIFGTDYNDVLISWCQNHIRFARFTVNGLREKLNYADNNFDLIYALSVFTHLDENLQFFWIDELVRVLQPGGFFFVTVHGEFHLKDARTEDKEMFLKGKLVIHGEEVPGTNMCNVIHPPSYMKEKFAPHLNLLDHVPGGALGNPRQDGYLYQKPLK